MSLELRGSNTYYYAKERVGRRVISRYIGKVGRDEFGQLLFDLEESCRGIKAMEKQQREAEIALMMMRHNDQFAGIDETIAHINLLAKVILLAFGHHQHKGQWRKARVNTNLEGRANMMINAQMMIDAQNISKFDIELIDLVLPALRKKMGSEEAKALRAYLESHPEIWHDLHNISQISIDAALDASGNGAVTAELLRVKLKALQQDLGWDEASTLVRLMIEAVVMSYLRWCLTEIVYSTNTEGKSVVLVTATFLEKKLAQSQKQYLRACESLARVRRLSLNCPEMSQDFTQNQSLVM